MITHGVLYKLDSALLAQQAWARPQLPGVQGVASESDVTQVKVRYRQPEQGVLYSQEGGIRKESLENNGVGRWLDVYA